MIPRLKELYLKEIQPALKTEFGFKNLNMGPKIEKIILNMGLGEDGSDGKKLKAWAKNETIKPKIINSFGIIKWSISMNVIAISM